MDITINLAELSDEDLAAHQAEVREAFDALIAEEAPTREQVDEARALGDRLDEITAIDGERQAAAEQLAADAEAQRARFAEPEVADETAEVEAEEAAPEAAAAETAEATAEGTATAVEEVAVDTSAADESIRARASTVAVLAGRTRRPAAPTTSQGRSGPVKIIASANTEFSAGSDLGSDLEKVNQSMLAKVLSFTAPNGDGKTEDLHKYPIAKFALDFPEELVQKQHTSDMEMLWLAGDEHRLPEESLTAAAGWCAPSETLYDLCSTESTDGIGSVPEMAITRGGIKFTSGPDFSSIYGAAGYFDFTEAQSIAGTGQSVSKPCATVTCPSFTDVRLDSVGLCIKVEFLANQAYPELTQRFISGALIAHQHKVWLKVLNKMLTAATAKTWLAGAGSPDGSVLSDSLDGLTLYKDHLLQKYKLPLSTSMELLLPYWLPDAIKADISRRNGLPVEATTTEFIASLYRARGFNPQFVYGLPAGTAAGGVDLALADVTGPPAQDSDTWPTVYTALMYPAGTFVKGTADVVNLSSVYDAASLANNIYTGLFVEQGVLVAQLCPEAFKVTLPVCAAGRVGVADLSCA